ncbi:MAG: hypothetical protein K0Q65_1901 [Clostridia bacterium]|nr:hypothetical protein [Clostridia bacterium]
MSSVKLKDLHIKIYADPLYMIDYFSLSIIDFIFATIISIATLL